MTNRELYEKAVKVIRSVDDPTQVPMMVRYFNRAKRRIGLTSLYRDMIEVVYNDKTKEMIFFGWGKG